MQVSALIEKVQIGRLSPLQRKVLDYLEQHPSEVFEYRDSELTQAVGGKPSSVGFSLWALHKKGLIDKETAGGKVYFGSKRAMAELRQELGISAEDPFDRATRNLKHIRQAVGNIDVQSLLDEVRDES